MERFSYALEFYNNKFYDLKIKSLKLKDENISKYL